MFGKWREIHDGIIVAIRKNRECEKLFLRVNGTLKKKKWIWKTNLEKGCKNTCNSLLFSKHVKHNLLFFNNFKEKKNFIWILIKYSCNSGKNIYTYQYIFFLTNIINIDNEWFGEKSLQWKKNFCIHIYWKRNIKYK